MYSYWHVGLTTAWLHELLFLQCNYRVLFIYSSACKLWGEKKLFKVSIDLLGSTQYAQIVTGFSHISIQIRYAHTLPASSFPSKYVSSHQRHITLCYSPKIMVRKNMVNMVTCYLFFINIMWSALTTKCKLLFQQKYWLIWGWYNPKFCQTHIFLSPQWDMCARR